MKDHDKIKFFICTLIFNLLINVAFMYNPVQNCKLIGVSQHHRNITDWKGTDEWYGIRRWKTNDNLNTIFEYSGWTKNKHSVDSFVKKYQKNYTAKCDTIYKTVAHNAIETISLFMIILASCMFIIVAIGFLCIASYTIYDHLKRSAQESEQDKHEKNIQV